MRVRIFEALDLDRKIMNIKHLREATGLGLKQSKDIVDELYEGRSSAGIEVRIKDNFSDDDYDAFREWFDYDTVDTPAPKGTLTLFRVIYTDNGNSYTAVVLATSKPRADAAARQELQDFFDVEPSAGMVTTIKKVTSFRNGQVLLMSRL